MTDDMKAHPYEIAAKRPEVTWSRIDSRAPGRYEGFTSNWIGANEHSVRFASGAHHALKLRDMIWEVTAPAPPLGSSEQR